MFEEIERYDPYTDKFIKNTTTDRIEVGTDGSLHNLSISNSYGLYAKNQEELDKCDYIDKSTKLYTKEEVVSMLTDIQLELDEMKITKVRSAGFAPYSKDPFRRGVNCSKEIIQQKINSLKGDSNDKID